MDRTKVQRVTGETETLAKSSFTHAHHEVRRQPEVDRDALVHLLRAIAALPEPKAAKPLKLSHECELKLYIPPSVVLRAVNLEKHPSFRLRQFYFPAVLKPYLTEFVERSAGARFPQGFRVTQLRMRLMGDNGRSSAVLELKGAKTSVAGAKVTRPEAPRIKIKDPQLVEILRKLAVRGQVHKQRWEFEGWVRGAGGKKCPVVLQLDQLRRSGPGQADRLAPRVRRRIFLADIELLPVQVKSFLAGKHSFTMLKEGRAIVLSKEPKSVQKAFSARSLAKEGVSAKLLELVDVLNQRVRDQKQVDTAAEASVRTSKKSAQQKKK